MTNIRGFIGCRLGSTRVKFKNLSLIDNKPLFTYLTNSALSSSKINSLYLNTDSQYIVDIAKEIYKENLNYYIRPSHLGSSNAKLDDFVFDFMINFPSDITIFFNPCCLFLKTETIDKAIDYFLNNNLDSLCASRVAQTLCFLENRPLNFSFKTSQPRTQDLKPIHCQTCAFFIWKTSSFVEEYKKNSSANFNGKFESYGLSSLEAIDIDTEDDFLIAESILLGKKRKFSLTYHNHVDDLIKKGLISPN
tara:strand:- start:11283 stop:12029 length:747 start_codon:yes stop_codon:yes gene_type:complete